MGGSVGNMTSMIDVEAAQFDRSGDDTELSWIETGEPSEGIDAIAGLDETTRSLVDRLVILQPKMPGHPGEMICRTADWIGQPPRSPEGTRECARSSRHSLPHRANIS